MERDYRHFWNACGVCAVISCVCEEQQKRQRRRGQGVDEAKSDATVLTEIGYIKANTDDIKRKQEKQDETLVKMTERVVKLEGDSARTNKRLEILESHDYGGSK